MRQYSLTGLSSILGAPSFLLDHQVSENLDTFLAYLVKRYKTLFNYKTTKML